jgi:Cu-Zn family superoxide dismutase
MRAVASIACLALCACAGPPAPSPPSTPPPVPLPVAQPPETLPVAAPAAAQQATAVIRDVANTRIGAVSLTDTPAGLLVTGTVAGLGIGLHGVHLHAVGLCQAPGFTTAGPHFNPTGAKHGFKNPAGPHRGDMPNIVSPPAGSLGFHFVLGGVKLSGRGGAIDDDGLSIVIHSGEDDYFTDPAGNTGGRLACGVFMVAK